MNSRSSISSAGKYVALTRYLRALPANETTVTLSFRDLELILTFPLPPSARKYRPWWANQTNNAGRPQAQGWMDAGFVVGPVNVDAGTVRFSRDKDAAMRSTPSVKKMAAAANVAINRPAFNVPESATQDGGTRKPIDPGMRRRIVLVSCAAKKTGHIAQAQDLYVSPLFQRALAYARFLGPDHIYILSARDGLLDLTREIEPYDLTLKDMSSNDARGWADKVLSQLAQKTDLSRDTFIFLAGDAYRRFLVSKLAHWEAPLAGLPIGKQLQRLNELLNERRL
jgi:hypothetical protein